MFSHVLGVNVADPGLFVPIVGTLAPVLTVWFDRAMTPPVPMVIAILAFAPRTVCPVAEATEKSAAFPATPMHSRAEPMYPISDALFCHRDSTPLVLLLLKFMVSPPAPFTVIGTPLAFVKVCDPVHVGTIVTSSAGAPSERMKEVAEPFTAVSVVDAVGFAPTGRDWSPVFVPLVVPPPLKFDVNVSVYPLIVVVPALTVSPAPKVCRPDHVGTIATDSAGAESEVMNVAAVPLTADNPTEADGLADAGIAGSADHCGAVAPAFTVRYFPAKPMAKNVVAPAAVLYGTLPARPPATFVAVVAEVAVAALPVQEPEDPDTEV